MFKYRFTVDESQTNNGGTLHGAYIAYLVDHTTSISIALTGLGPIHAGVSVGMNINYLRSAKVDDVVTVVTSCKKVGRTLAFLEASLSNADGKLIATASHTKYVGEKD